MMLKIGPDDRAVASGGRRHSSLIPEGVHLLFHDIRNFPIPGRRDRSFQNGYADLPATEGSEDFPCLVFTCAISCFLGKDVLKTFDAVMSSITFQFGL